MAAVCGKVPVSLFTLPQKDRMFYAGSSLREARFTDSNHSIRVSRESSISREGQSIFFNEVGKKNEPNKNFFLTRLDVKDLTHRIFIFGEVDHPTTTSV